MGGTQCGFGNISTCLARVEHLIERDDGSNELVEKKHVLVELDESIPASPATAGTNNCSGTTDADVFLCWCYS
jgi:hypothetical protein